MTSRMKPFTKEPYISGGLGIVNVEQCRRCAEEAGEVCYCT